MSREQSGWIVRAPGALERLDACFHGKAFSPHRHDTYVVAITLAGVQRFSYRGAARHSRPGQIVVLHPDELHDGEAGDGGRFRYRGAYLPPSSLQATLGGRPLPFIATGVSDAPALGRAVRRLVGDLTRPLTGLECEESLLDLAGALVAAAGGPLPQPKVDAAAVGRARAFIDAHATDSVSLADLERIGGRSRWCLSRDFRALLGVSPHRYLVFRRLEAARTRLQQGLPLADVAASCGFSDQSHFARHFRRAYGMTPTEWRRHEQPYARSFYRSHSTEA